MTTYILLTRISAAFPKDQKSYLTMNEEIKQRIENECPQITWKSNYAVSGPYDYLDIFEAPSNEVAAHVALIIRITGHAETEIWNATSWDTYKAMLQKDERSQSIASREAAGPVNEVDEAGRESFPASDPPAWTGR